MLITPKVLIISLKNRDYIIGNWIIIIGDRDFPDTVPKKFFEYSIPLRLLGFLLMMVQTHSESTNVFVSVFPKRTCTITGSTSLILSLSENTATQLSSNRHNQSRPVLLWVVFVLEKRNNRRLYFSAFERYPNFPKSPLSRFGQIYCWFLRTKYPTAFRAKAEVIKRNSFSVTELPWSITTQYSRRLNLLTFVEPRILKLFVLNSVVSFALRRAIVHIYFIDRFRGKLILSSCKMSIEMLL